MKFKFHFLPILIFLVVTIIFRFWFYKTGILTYSDWMFLYPESIDSFAKLPSNWITGSLGGVNIFSYFNPINYFIFILNSWNLSYGLIERIVFFIPSVFFSYWGMYFLAFHLTKNRIASIFSALVFLINTYVLIISSAHLTIFAAMAFLPFIFLFYIKGVDTKKIKYLFVSSLMLTISSAYEFRIFYIIVGILSLYAVFNIFFDRSYKKVLNRFLALFYVLLLPAIFNFYWLYGLTQTGHIKSNGVFDRSLFGDGFLDIFRAFTFSHPFWNGQKIIEFTTQKVNPISFLFPILAFSGLYLGRKNKNILFFGLISLAGIFLTKQSGYPFEKLYLWLFNNFPGFNAFREASKFFILISFGYSILIGYTFSKLFLEKNYKIVRNFLFLLLSFILLSYSYPLFTGKVGNLFQIRNLPQEYGALNQYLKQNDDYYKILWFPRKSRWSYYDKKINLLSFDEILNSVPQFATQSGSLSQKIIESSNSPDFNLFLNESGIRFVIVPLEDNDNDDNFYKYYINKEKFVEALDSLAYLNKINLGIEGIEVYENLNYFGLVDVLNKEEEIVEINRDSPHEINFKLQNINPEKEELQILFSNYYHPDWNLLTSSKNSSLGTHSQSNFGQNVFSIEIDEICKIEKCIYDQNQKLELNLMIYFDSQTNFQKLFYISRNGSGVFVILSLVLIAYQSKKNV